MIGDEILSGRVQDANIRLFARKLGTLGITFAEARVIPDVTELIVEAVNACRRCHDYVFTTGGIGPTHDDITSAAIAKAFGVPLVRDARAEALLRAQYGDKRLNPARLTMADVPEGATLIDNPISKAPGFRLGNVFVLAGVPFIAEAMFEGLQGQLEGGAPVVSRTIVTYLTEGNMAERLSALQEEHADVALGSYPFLRGGQLGTSLVVRGRDEGAVERAAGAVRALIREYGFEPMDEDPAPN